MDEPELSDYEKYRGKCREMSEAACEADPTLRLVRGHYYDPLWGKEPHWWCVRPDGTIHDPTKLQFPSKGAGEYVEFDGMCHCEYCGNSVHEEKAVFNGHHPYCSDRCAIRDVL